jgi:hypothetical protein
MYYLKLKKDTDKTEESYRMGKGIKLRKVTGWERRKLILVNTM